jgi:hypothetical protein
MGFLLAQRLCSALPVNSGAPGSAGREHLFQVIFLTQIVHHPCGLIGPATSLQLLVSGMKCMHEEQLSLPFGWSWYCTAAWASFAGADSAPVGAGCAAMPDLVAGGTAAAPGIELDSGLGDFLPQPAISGRHSAQHAATKLRSIILRCSPSCVMVCLL